MDTRIAVTYFQPDRKNDDHTHDARLDHKRVKQPQTTCYSCGLKGHKSTSRTNKERGKKCYGCKNFGHIHSNCPKNSTNSLSTSNRNTSASSDRTVHPISQLSGQSFVNPIRILVILVKIQFTALCDTGSQATIINDKTYRSIGSPPLYPSYITFSGFGRDKVHSIEFFQDFITIEDTTLPAKIHVVSDTSIPLDVIIGMDFLQQTEFTFDKQGIRLCNKHTDDRIQHLLVAYIALNFNSAVDVWYAGRPCGIDLAPSDGNTHGSDVMVLAFPHKRESWKNFMQYEKRTLYDVVMFLFE
ncbi:hypothetical protein HNY73_018560 [Argiope bruennichi]|uniref:CCHC-type domain-containing protein n=1 Tax=Argiope bruennichi TaxID=94029 RepID=A0A8T0EDM2_ARGBR|nr:hypothetical protein HNY73_018560 [Argiope bruennichi]